MITGLYAATSGMLANSRALDTIGNNVSNAGSAGYKTDDVIFTSFGDALTYRIGGSVTAGVGTTSNGALVDTVYTDYRQGNLEETGRSLDLALWGNGFFTVRQPNGAEALTRNGQFAVDANGYLIDAMGNQVLGQNGALQVGIAEIAVDGTGRVYAAGQYIDTLRITSPQDPAALTKQEGGLLTGFAGQPQAAWDGKVQQGYLETSSVDLGEEVTGMIERSRAFQSCSQMVKMLDTVLEKTVNEIGRI